MIRLARRKQRVAELTAQAAASSARAADHKEALRTWSRDTFGTLEALSLSFAAGALWSATRARHDDASSNADALRRAARFSVIAWPYLRTALVQQDVDVAAEDPGAEALL